ncbi:MAG: TraB/GumN family protein [Muribaculaceae bacterium]|nr:TraB/GumN family protein [Muribaculaceae bacterium]
MKRKIFAIASMALLFVATASAQIFYKIEGKDLSAPSYIFGTHHLAPLSVIDQVPGCRDAFDSVKQVVGEIDMTIDQMTLAMQMQPYMIAPTDSTLSKLFTPEELKVVDDEFQKWAPMPGMSVQMLDMMRPMVLTSMMSIGMVQKELPNYNPAEQLDLYFQTSAKESGKDVKGLETPEFQAKVLYTTVPIAEQAKALLNLAKDPKESLEKSAKLNELYLAQDLDGLLELTNTDNEDSDEGAFMEALVDLRNANWIKELPEIMKETPSFIAVGALHLPGEKGVIEGLRKAGYTVTAVK